jgi:hypothetical protein
MLALAFAAGGSFVARAEAADPGTEVKIGKKGVSVDTGNTKVKVRGTGVDVDTEDDDDSTAGIVNEDEEAAGKSLQIVGNGKKLKHACAGNGATLITITGGDHDITLTGECKQVTITGSRSKVTAEAVGAIIVTGSDVQVFYKRGLDNKPPKITKTGTRIKVTKLDH